MKLVSKIFVIVFSMMLSGSLIAQDQLNKYLTIAAENNPGLKAKFNEYMAALERIPQAGALPDPQFAFGYFIEPVQTRVGPQQYRFSLTQRFPWFGTLSAKEDVLASQAKAAFQEFEQSKSELYFKVRSIYYNLYFIDRAIHVSEENIKILNSIKNLALIKIESGETSAVNGIRVDMNLADLENNFALLNDKRTVLLLDFNNLLNIEMSSTVEIPDTLWNYDLLYSTEAIMDSLAMNNHRIQGFRHMTESFINKEAAAKKSGLPEFSIGVDYISIGKSDNPMVDTGSNGKDAIVFPMIGLSIPLYRQKYSAMVAEAVYQQQAMDHKIQDNINSLHTMVGKVQAEYLDAERRINLNERQIESAQKALQILESEYTTDGKNFEEILRMARRVLSYNLELEKARSDKQASLAFIEFLMGN